MVKWDGRGAGLFVLAAVHSSVLPSGDTLSASMHALSLFSLLCTSRPQAPENDHVPAVLFCFQAGLVFVVVPLF